MDQNGVQDAARAHVYKGQQHAQQESIEELKQISMEQTKSQARKDHGGQFSPTGDLIQQQPAEKQLFQYRSKQNEVHYGQQSEVVLPKRSQQGIFRSGIDKIGKPGTGQIPCIHKHISYGKNAYPLPGRQRAFFKFGIRQGMKKEQGQKFTPYIQT